MALVQDEGGLRDRWVARYNTVSTRKLAVTALNAFSRYLKSVNLTEGELFSRISNSEDEDERYHILDEIVQFWKQEGMLPITISTYFTFLRGYFRHNKIKTAADDVKDYVSFPKKVKEIRKPLTLTKIRQLLEFCGPRHKAILLILVSSGMRISEVLHLRPADFDTSTFPIKITIPAQFTKTKQSRYTYISKEAWIYTEPFVKGCKPGEFIFPIILPNMEQYMRWLRTKSGLLERYETTGNYVVNLHAFRAYFHTKATLLHGAEYAHASIGHGSYLQQYFRLTEEERRDKYKQLEPYVTVYDDQITKMENEKLKDQNQSIGELKAKYEKIILFLQAHPQFAKEFAQLKG